MRGRVMSSQANFLEDFVDKLKHALQADGKAGSGTRLRISNALDRVNTSSDTTALDTRFALGADDAMYLNVGVAPIHASRQTESTYAAVTIPSDLTAAVEKAAGSEFLSLLKRKRREGRRSLYTLFDNVGWLLCIEEVRLAVVSCLNTEDDQVGDDLVMSGLAAYDDDVDANETEHKRALFNLLDSYKFRTDQFGTLAEAQHDFVKKVKGLCLKPPAPDALGFPVARLLLECLETLASSDQSAGKSAEELLRRQVAEPRKAHLEDVFADLIDRCSEGTSQALPAERAVEEYILAAQADTKLGNLIPRGNCTADSIADALGLMRPPSSSPEQASSLDYRWYSLARGLCAYPAPFHELDTAESADGSRALPYKFRYSLPSFLPLEQWPKGHLRRTTPSESNLENNEPLYQEDMYSYKENPSLQDISNWSSPVLQARWVPEWDEPHVCEAAVLELAIQYTKEYKSQMNENLPMWQILSKVAAYLKMKQLMPLLTSLRPEPRLGRRELANSASKKQKGEQPSNSEPEQQQPAKCFETMSYQIVKRRDERSNSDLFVPTSLVEDTEGVVISPMLLGLKERIGARKEDCKPYTSRKESWLTDFVNYRVGLTQSLAPWCSLDAIHSGLCAGIHACDDDVSLTNDILRLEKARDANAQPDEPVASFLQKQAAMTTEAQLQAIRDEAKREISIGGDRLYAFLRTLSGYLGEPVETVLVSTDEAASKQQRMLSDAKRRIEAAITSFQTRAAELVIGAALKDSPIALEVGHSGADLARLSVVNSNARDAVRNLASGVGGGGGRGFFTDGVELANSLNATSEPASLETVLADIPRVAKLMYEKLVEQSSRDMQMGTSVAAANETRHSLLVRLAAPCVASIEKANRLFKIELSYHSHHMEPPSLWELCEGPDSNLTACFCDLVATVFRSVRQTSTDLSTYVSSSAVVLNRFEQSVSMRRLVAAFCDYRMRHARPDFSNSKNRVQVFGNVS